MTAGKSERLLNLLIMLLVQRRYVGKDRIREILYPDSTVDAFEKMFEPVSYTHLTLPTILRV